MVKICNGASILPARCYGGSGIRFGRYASRVSAERGPIGDSSKVISASHGADELGCLW